MKGGENENVNVRRISGRKDVSMYVDRSVVGLEESVISCAVHKRLETWRGPCSYDDD